MSGSRLYLVRYVMGGLLLCKVGVLWLVTCYVKNPRRCVGALAVSLLSMFFVCFFEVVNESFVRCMLVVVVLGLVGFVVSSYTNFRM